MTIEFASNISPPGLYTVLITENMQLNLPHNESDIILENVPGDATENFQIIRTNEDGEFKLKLPITLADAIFVHVFPMNDDRKFMRSPITPSTFLKSVFWLNDWKSRNYSDKELWVINPDERNPKLNKMLTNWLRNDNLPEVEAFFIRANLKYGASRMVKLFTNNIDIPPNDLDMLEMYGDKMVKYEAQNQNLTNKLAKIAGFKRLVKYFCIYLNKEKLSDDQKTLGTVPVIDYPKMMQWKKLC
ncbi:hypothetical protein niasHS_015843 [Heterodera schachtii]|uniref:Uncharacterized protein n=1 Tax=Heterodera schachtii TaxID=97005 RepID=A0ABD2HWP1_HETSC